MFRGIFLLSLFLAGFTQSPLAADRKLVAEGDYVAHKKDSDKLLAHWTL
jgi:hypothetical protein